MESTDSAAAAEAAGGISLLEIGYWSLTLALSIVAAVGMVILARNRKKWLPALEDVVTLDSGGWRLLAWTAGLGAAIMIATSQMFGWSYWTGLAISADQIVIKPATIGVPFTKFRIPWGWTDYLTVGVISFAVLAVIFEVVSDLGVPISSGMKQRNKKAIPEALIIATVACLAMSLVSKWGYYEDKRSVRSIEAAKIAIQDSDAAVKLREAQATITRLADTPSLKVAQAKEDALQRSIDDKKAERTEKRAARDELPANFATKRLEYDSQISELTREIGEQELAKVEATSIREDAQAYAAAIVARDAATKELENNAGLTDHGKEIVKAGDQLWVRILRVGVHQLLCFLLPIVAIESFAAAKEKKRREDAARKGAKTKAFNRSQYDEDAEFEEADLGPPKLLETTAVPETDEEPDAWHPDDDDVFEDEDEESDDAQT